MCRLYTGIHAKPKPKFKTGAISESTTALNVDQTNTEMKNAASGGAMPLQPPLTPSTTTATRGSSQEQTASVTTETVGNGSGAGDAATLVSAAPVPQKKETGVAKVQADKKKIDARKKSLKRL